MLEFHSEDFFLVTGASSGIGEAISLLLNKQGASVIAVARNSERLEGTRAKSKYPENIHIEQKNLVENIDGLPDFVKDLKEKYGKLTGLVCAAGIDIVRIIRTVSTDDFDKIFKINYQVPMLLTKGFADKRNNIGEGASIVFIASIAGVYPDKGQIAYAASKAALIASSRAISKELSARKIRCNCISPAWVDTPMFRKNEKEYGANTEQYDLGIGRPDDIANLAVYLLNPAARWITGQNYLLEGGGY